MSIRNDIINIIESEKIVPTQVALHSNLYKDLGFDSLSFITLLVEIEGMYSITFDISEMELCLHVENLINIVQAKLKELNINDETYN